MLDCPNVRDAIHRFIFSKKKIVTFRPHHVYCLVSKITTSQLKDHFFFVGFWFLGLLKVQMQSVTCQNLIKDALTMVIPI